MGSNWANDIMKEIGDFSDKAYDQGWLVWLLIGIIIAGMAILFFYKA